MEDLHGRRLLSTFDKKIRPSYSMSIEKTGAKEADEESFRKLSRVNRSQIEREGILSGDQSRGATPGDIQPGPLERDQQAVLKLDHIDEVDENPDQPCGEARKADPVEIG